MKVVYTSYPFDPRFQSSLAYQKQPDFHYSEKNYSVYESVMQEVLKKFKKSPTATKINIINSVPEKEDKAAVLQTLMDCKELFKEDPKDIVKFLELYRDERGLTEVLSRDMIERILEYLEQYARYCELFATTKK